MRIIPSASALINVPDPGPGRQKDKPRDARVGAGEPCGGEHALTRRWRRYGWGLPARVRFAPALFLVPIVAMIDHAALVVEAEQRDTRHRQQFATFNP